jgi:hypothetical protein
MPWSTPLSQTRRESTLSDTYFLISVSDGDIRIHSGDSEDIIGYLDTDEDTGELTTSAFHAHERFEGNPMYWDDNRVLIIKGEVVTPKPVSVDYELE